VEAILIPSASPKNSIQEKTQTGRYWEVMEHVRCRNDNLSINEFLIKFGILAFLVRGRDESMSLIFNPFSNSELVLCCTEELWFLFGVDTAL
jgi:hypothetical protein